jgi:hypothetical protein
VLWWQPAKAEICIPTLVLTKTKENAECNLGLPLGIWLCSNALANRPASNSPEVGLQLRDEENQ